MSDNKKFFWLKLQSDFFSSLSIKKLRRIAGGDTYTIIYLKMLLFSLKTEGLIEFEGVESNLCEELALCLDENTDDVTVTLQFLLKCGLAEMMGENLLLPEVIENTGSEGASAQRMRKLREKKTGQLLQAVTSSAQSDAQTSQCDTSVTQRREEKEKREISFAAKPPKKSKTFIPPALEEVKQYVSEKKLSVDPQSFIDYFEAADWHDSKGQPVRSWKQKALTWSKNSFSKPEAVKDDQTPKGVIHL